MLHVREENSMSQISERKCRTSKCFDENRRFDEYGHYGENNGPLPPTKKLAAGNEDNPIREMTDEERQRAKEREEKNRGEG
jgi:hypothetical protein